MAERIPLVHLGDGTIGELPTDDTLARVETTATGDFTFETLADLDSSESGVSALSFSSNNVYSAQLNLSRALTADDDNKLLHVILTTDNTSDTEPASGWLTLPVSTFRGWDAVGSSATPEDDPGIAIPAMRSGTATLRPVYLGRRSDSAFAFAATNDTYDITRVLARLISPEVGTEADEGSGGGGGDDGGGGGSSFLSSPDEFDERGGGAGTDGDGVYFFFGWESEGGGADGDGWLIRRQTRSDSTTVEADEDNNSSHTALSTAWAARTSLTYA